MQGGRWRAPWVAALSLMALPATAAAELRITAAGTSGDVAIEADVPCSLERQDRDPGSSSPASAAMASAAAGRWCR
jgi:hypothetical protein